MECILLSLRCFFFFFLQFGAKSETHAAFALAWKIERRWLFVYSYWSPGLNWYNGAVYGTHVPPVYTGTDAFSLRQTSYGTLAVCVNSYWSLGLNRYNGALYGTHVTPIYKGTDTFSLRQTSYGTLTRVRSRHNRLSLCYAKNMIIIKELLKKNNVKMRTYLSNLLFAALSIELKPLQSLVMAGPN